jgi:hypothetical protein
MVVLVKFTTSSSFGFLQLRLNRCYAALRLQLLPVGGRVRIESSLFSSLMVKRAKNKIK